MFTDKYVYESYYMISIKLTNLAIRMCISFVTSIHKFPNLPIHDFFIDIFIHLMFFFWIKIIQPFLNLEGALKCNSQHHENNHNTKFRSIKNIRGLVKINWWIDVMNKIVSFFRWCSLRTCLLINKFPPIFIFVSENEYRR